MVFYHGARHGGHGTTSKKQTVEPFASIELFDQLVLWLNENLQRAFTQPMFASHLRDSVSPGCVASVLCTHSPYVNGPFFLLSVTVINNLLLFSCVIIGSNTNFILQSFVDFSLLFRMICKQGIDLESLHRIVYCCYLLLLLEYQAK